jgi:hypothetical protein
MSLNLNSIPAFDGSNYSYRKARMRFFFKSTDVWHVTSHIAWEGGCAYMYKCTIYDTTRFKAVMAMNLSELRS